MYRGWYKGEREFGSAVVPWEFCLAEWNAQFFGDRAFQISEPEKANLRWEAKQFRAGKLWHRWDYPARGRLERLRRAVPGLRHLPHRQLARLSHLGRVRDFARGSTDTSGSCATAWTERRKELKVDWENLQRPGFSPDYVEQRYERMDLAFERSDWMPTPAARPCSATTGRCWPTSAASPTRSRARTTTSSPGRNGREADHRHQQLPRDGHVRVRLVAGLAAGPSTGSKRVHRGRRASRSASRCASSCRQRSPPGTLRTDRDRPVQQRRDAEGFLRHPRPAASARASGRTRRSRSSIPRARPKPGSAGREFRCQRVDANADLSGYDMLDRRQGRSDDRRRRRRTSRACATG